MAKGAIHEGATDVLGAGQLPQTAPLDPTLPHCLWHQFPHCSMELGHLLHSALTCPRMHSVSTRDTHLCLLHNSAVLLTITICVRITNGWRRDWKSLQDSALSFPTLAPNLLEWPSWEQPVFAFTAFALGHWCWTLLFLLVQMRYGPLCSLWVWRRRTNYRPCCPPMSNTFTQACNQGGEGPLKKFSPPWKKVLDIV